MTEAEYLSPERFPLTTQRGLTLDQQHMIDAHNRDELEAEVRRGRPLDAEQQQVLRELKQKLQAVPRA
jgi:hypothetical protein